MKTQASDITVHAVGPQNQGDYPAYTVLSVYSRTSYGANMSVPMTPDQAEEVGRSLIRAAREARTLKAAGCVFVDSLTSEVDDV